MNYLSFHNELKRYPVFSVLDIYKTFQNFDNRRLVEWQKKGYITKIRRGFYCFSDRNQNENFIHFAANKLYSPSYISLESALSYYGLIPEGVFLLTSVSTRNTTEFHTSIGNFNYKHLKKKLFFGYQIFSKENIIFKVGEVEKVILDYLYLNKIDSLEKMKEMRFNSTEIKKIVNFETLDKYLILFDSNVLNKRVKLFKKVVNA